MRIITGSARGSRLVAPKGLATRPTADRVKEAVFSILGTHVVGRHVLDLYAGSGALALEALSRGAAAATLVDSATADILEKNATHTHLADRARILRTDVRAALKRLEAAGECYDLIFADPPYHRGGSELVLAALDAGTLLAENGILVLEHGADEDGFAAENLTCVMSRRFGAVTSVSFFQRKSYLSEEGDA